jgi:hypothetical protein
LQWFIYIGLVSLFVAGLCVGAWTQGGQQRGNFYSQPREDPERRNKLATWFAAVGLLLLAIAGIIYLLHYNG